MIAYVLTGLAAWAVLIAAAYLYLLFCLWLIRVSILAATSLSDRWMERRRQAIIRRGEQ